MSRRYKLPIVISQAILSRPYRFLRQTEKSDAFPLSKLGTNEMLLLRHGWIAWCYYSDAGKRHINELTLPGEFVLPRARIETDSHGLPEAVGLVGMDVITLEKPLEPNVAEAIMLVHERHAHESRARLQELCIFEAYDRLWHLFARLDDRIATFQSDDISKNFIGLSQQHIADLVGLTVVHTNKILRKLREQEVISKIAGSYVLHKQPHSR